MMLNKLTLLKGKVAQFIANRDFLGRYVCECGKEVVKYEYSVRSGKTTSCGQGSCRLPRRQDHKHSSKYSTSRTYNSWSNMKQRCLNPKSTAFSYYGGRGIKISPRWLDFNSFLEDMGERPQNRTLDRIDVNGDYEAGNCRWATKSEQSRNQRRSTYL